MKLNLRFVNTGLDDRIVKSLPSSMHPAKTEKMVFVHDKKKGDYYRKQQVNMEQPKIPEVNHKNTNYNSEPQTLEQMIEKLSKLGIPVTSSTVDLEGINAIKNANFKMHGNIEKLTSGKSYSGYTVYQEESDVDSQLGTESFDDEDRDSPGDSHYREFYKDVNEFEFATVQGYVYSYWTHPMNNWLRKLEGDGVKLPKDEDEVNVVKTMTKHLDSFISKYTLEKPTVTYRHMRISALEHILSKGDGTYKDNGFISTSVFKNNFSLGNEACMTMVIKVPAGKGHGVWVKPLSSIPYENEFLLSRGTTFKIHSLNVMYDKNNKLVNAMVEVEVTGHDQEVIDDPQMEYDEDIDWYKDICETPPE